MKRRIGLFLFCTLSFISIAHAAEIRTVALSGQQVPGAPEGTILGGFEPPVLNDAGQTAFRSGGGIWSEGSGSLELVAALGQQAPGMPDGVTYGRFVTDTRIVINDIGTTAFPAHVTGPGGGIWSSGPGGSALIAVYGQQAAGTSEGTFYYLTEDSLGDRILLNDAGQVAFPSSLYGSGVDSSNDCGIWAQRHGSLELVAREGNQAPGTPDGVNFRELKLNSPISLNNLGQTAFRGTLTGSGVNATNDVGVWSEGSGGLALVVREGSQAPGMPDGAVFNVLSAEPDLNNVGQTAFYSTVTGGGVDATNNFGIWLGTAGSLSLVVRSGTPAPGTPSGVNIAAVFWPALNDAGQVAFVGTLTGAGVNSTNSLGLWSGAADSLALIARSGDHAPGTDDGVVFRSVAANPRPGPSLMLNAAGQTAFIGLLSGSGISASNEFGIWATDRSGALQLIAREGDPLEVAPGDFRTILYLDLPRSRFSPATGNSDGRPSFFNNSGQLAFRARFTDGTSGIFVSNRVAVPEPSTFALAALSAAGLLLRRRVCERRGRRGTLILAN